MKTLKAWCQFKHGRPDPGRHGYLVLARRRKYAGTAKEAKKVTLTWKG